MRILLIVAALGWGCSQPPEYVDDKTEDPDPPLPPAKTESIQVANSMDKARSDQFGTEFALLTNRDLFAKVRVRHEGGLQFLKFDLLNNTGVAQQTRWMAFTTDPSAPEQINHPLIDEKMPVEKVSLQDGFVTIYVHIPVAGTALTRYKLTGEFTARVSLGIGDEPKQIASKISFTR